MFEYSLVLHGIRDYSAAKRAQLIEYLASHLQVSPELIGPKLKELPLSLSGFVHDKDLNEVISELENLGAIVEVMEAGEAAAGEQGTALPEEPVQSQEQETAAPEEPMESKERLAEEPAALDELSFDLDAGEPTDTTTDSSGKSENTIEATDLETLASSLSLDEPAGTGGVSEPDLLAEDKPTDPSEGRLDFTSLETELAFEFSEEEPKAVSADLPPQVESEENADKLSDAEPSTGSELSFDSTDPTSAGTEEVVAPESEQDDTLYGDIGDLEDLLNLAVNAPLDEQASDITEEEGVPEAKETVFGDMAFSPQTKQQEHIEEEPEPIAEPLREEPEEQVLIEEPAADVITEGGEQRKLTKLHLGLIGGGVLLVVILVLFGIFSSEEGPRKIDLTSEVQIQRLLAEQEKILRQGNKEGSESTKEGVIQKWSGKGDESSATTIAAITTRDNRVEELSLDITTPEPAKLTAQEMVDGVPEPLWLRRVEAVLTEEDIVRSEEEDGKEDSLRFTANGSAKAYIRDGTRRDRILVEMEARGSVDVNTQKISGSWKISHNLDKETDIKSNLLERLSNNKIRISYSGTLLAEPVVENEKKESTDDADENKNKNLPKAAAIPVDDSGAN